MSIQLANHHPLPNCVLMPITGIVERKAHSRPERNLHVRPVRRSPEGRLELDSILFT